MRKIVFIVSGTLGHVAPALSIIKNYHNWCPNDFIIVISTIDEKKEVEQFIEEQLKVINNDYVKRIKVDIKNFNKQRRFRKIFSIKSIFKGIKTIQNIYKSYHVQVVVGMGGFLSGIATFATRNLNIPYIIHEQNTILGKANYLSYKRATYCLCSFPLKNKKCVTVGNPRMSDAINYLEQKNILTNKKQILITSGTSGAKSINKIAIELIKYDKFQNEDWEIIIVTGKKYFDEMLQKIKTISSKKKIKVISFTTDLLELMVSSNVIISRAGATTIFEAISLEKKMILIPSPNVTNNHQFYNAQYLKQQNACSLIVEKDLTKEKLYLELKKLMNNNIYIDEIKKIKQQLLYPLGVESSLIIQKKIEECYDRY